MEVIEMKQMGCYKGLDESGMRGTLGARGRVARAVMGVAVIAGAGLLYVWPVALLADVGVPSVVLWALAVPSLWLGVSHLVAATTGYRGCPEIGAIPSLILGRQVVTKCTPWEWLDRRIGTAAKV
jgi:hypothetical protein